MGGDKLDLESNKVLNSLQKKLNTVLDKLSEQFVTSLKANIQEQTNKLGILLSKIKGPQLPKNQLSQEVDMVLEPLMDLLEGSLQRYAQKCEKTVLKYILKELWKITIVCLEKFVVLPPLSEKAVSPWVLILLYKCLVDQTTSDTEDRGSHKAVSHSTERCKRNGKCQGND
jgi:hypothetical protein